MTKKKIIRDFIYLDTFRVNSFASQLDEGIAASRRIEEAKRLHTAGVLQQDASAATSELRLVEERILLDHIYNVLESAITPAFIDIRVKSGPAKASIDLAKSPLLRISGTVEIEDYREFVAFIEKYNELGKIVAYASFNRTGFTSEKQRDNALTEHATKIGLLQDPRLLNNLRDFVQTLNRDALNFLFDARKETGYQVRAPIDRRHLRYEEATLRGLYSAASIVPWTLVGIATYTPEAGETPKAEEDEEISKFKDGTPNMVLAYRNMFRHSHFFSNTFSRSLGDEIVVLPLAVYREIEIAVSEDEAPLSA
jgi:hypothetical protein